MEKILKFLKKWWKRYTLFKNKKNCLKKGLKKKFTETSKIVKKRVMLKKEDKMYIGKKTKKNETKTLSKGTVKD